MSSVSYQSINTGFTGLQSLDIQTFLGKTLTDDENDKVDAIITAVEAELVTRCNRNFSDSITYTEYFDANFIEVMPRNTPIASMEKIYINGVDKTSNYTLNTHYWVYDNCLVFATPVACFGMPYKAVKIDYKIRKFWGDDLALMVKQKVAYNFLTAENGGVGLTSFSFSGLSQQFDVSRFNKQWEDLIMRYTNFTI